MALLRVFIASASAAQPLADALVVAMDNLNKKCKGPPLWEVRPWWDKKSEVQRLGRTIFQGLLEQCRSADLAVTLLTGDDLTVKRGQKMREPRDNCIFEAGLFMGGLGLDGERSILVTSVKKDALPSDLQGVQHLSFPAPSSKQLNDPEWCKRTMTTVAQGLAEHVKGHLKGPPKRPTQPILSAEELIEREKPEGEGGDLDAQPGRAVVINTTQPAETKVVLANQVLKNMDSGVDYVYFFRADRQNAPVVASLLRALVLAGMQRGSDVKELNESEGEELIKGKGPEMLATLKRVQKHLWIHFLPEDRSPLLFCVHNARTQSMAKCYLRDVKGDQFMLWAEGKEAFKIASDLSALQRDEDEVEAVFYPSDWFALYGTEGERFLGKLKATLKSVFGRDLIKDVNALCFQSVKG